MSKQKLQDWASIADIVSGIAVILSLIYVGYELRQNTLAMEANSRQEFAHQDLTYLATALDSSVVARAIVKVEAGQKLTALEKSQLINRQHMNFRVFENAYYQLQKGTLETSEWTRYRQIIQRLICDWEPAQAMWSQFRTGFVPEFQEIVDEVHATCNE